MTKSLLIENGTVLTSGKNPAVLPNYSVLIENGRIAKIAPKAKIPRSAAKRIDAKGKVVMPGFINAHTHFYSSFARGFGKIKPAKDFVGVLENLWWRLDSALTVEDCYYSALVALLEGIRHGTTTFIDHHASPFAVRGSLAAIEKAVKQTGQRACLCYELSDRDGKEIARQGLQENAEFIRHCQKQGGDYLRALFGLHASFTLSNRTLEAAANIGHNLHTGFHIHVAEAASDEAYAKRHFGMPIVNRLQKFGILGPQSIAGHCVHVSEAEMDILAKTRTAVVHNPQSNMNNAVGVADLLKLNKHRVLVGLGTDAMTTNMLEELRVVLWAQHLSHQLPSVAFMESVSTLCGNNPVIAARYFDLGLGELQQGGAADLAIIDYDPVTPLDNTNFYGHLVFGISQAIVDTTICGGKVLMQNKRLTLGLDEERINAKSRELAKKLWSKL
jgi:putative selenium metabolism protein SsnA